MLTVYRFPIQILCKPLQEDAMMKASSERKGRSERSSLLTRLGAAAGMIGGGLPGCGWPGRGQKGHCIEMA